MNFWYIAQPAEAIILFCVYISTIIYLYRKAETLREIKRGKLLIWELDKSLFFWSSFKSFEEEKFFSVVYFKTSFSTLIRMFKYKLPFMFKIHSIAKILIIFKLKVSEGLLKYQILKLP